jgi:hypothetical protein
VNLSVGQWVLPLPFKYSFKFNTGLEFTFGNKKAEWFTLGVSYISNLSKSNYYSFTSAEITVTDKLNNVTYFNYHVKARGNGLYYHISRKFYPFKWKVDRQKKKFEEFKKQHPD